MKTILYIASNITNSGGVSRVLSLKTNYLVEEMNYNVHILSTNDETSTSFFDFSSKINFHYCPVRVNSISAFWAYKKYIQTTVHQINPDVIVVADNGIKSLFIKKWLPENVCIYELHSDFDYFVNHSYSGLKKHFNRFLVKKNLALFDKIVLLRKDNLNFIAKEKQIIIPNPLSFAPKEHSQLNNHQAIAVGRIVSIKGYDRMLKVWKKVVQKHTNYMLDIYGLPSDEVDLEQLISKYDLEKNVFVHQPVQNIQEKYFQADFLLHTSYYEASPMVFLEAMSCGLPIVCFDLPQQNLLIHNQNALVAQNENELADYIFSLIENQKLQPKLAQNAIEKSKDFRVEKIMQQWENLFKNI